MTVECYGRSTPTIVWTMKALSDGTVVSGDSLGHVQFWDGLTGTLISTFDQNDNKADVLALDVTSDESKVFTSGVDSRVVCIERQKLVGAEYNENSKWIVTHAQRPHTHDVKAMTILKKFKVNHNGRITKQTEILFTGGIDTKLCTYHVSEFGLRRPRSLYPWPSLRSPIVAANKAKILTMLRENHVDLYELAAAPSSPKQIHNPIVAPDEETLIGTIQVKRSSNLASCAISTGGTFLALCDSYAVFLFHLQMEVTNDKRKKAVASTIPILLPKGLLSIVAMQFIQESHLVVATSQSTIHIYSLVKNENGISSSLVQTISKSNNVGVRQAWLLPIHSILCSANGEWMATTRNSHDQSDGIVEIYRSVSDGYQRWWSLPTLNTAVTAVTFLELQVRPMIAVACVNFALYIFDLSTRELSDWSVQAGYPLSSNKIPNDLAGRNDYPIRIGTNPANPSTLLIVRILMLSMYFREEYIAKRSILSRLACHPRNINWIYPISPVLTSCYRFERYRIGKHSTLLTHYFSYLDDRDLLVLLWYLTCWKSSRKAVESFQKFMFAERSVKDQTLTRNHTIPHQNSLLAVRYV